MDNEKIEGPIRLMERFRRALMLADFDFHIHDEEKGESWREKSLEDLYTNMVEHVNKIRDWGYGVITINRKTAQIHTIKVVNYALMIATRIMEGEE